MCKHPKLIMPIEKFNRFLKTIGSELEEVFEDSNIYMNNRVIFDNTGILLYETFQLGIENEELFVKCLNQIDSENKCYLECIIKHFKKLENILVRYLFVLKETSKNYNDSVSFKKIEALYENCLNLEVGEYGKQGKPLKYQLNFKQKIYERYLSKTIQNVFERFNYLLEIYRNGPKMFDCRLLQKNESLQEKSVINKSLVPIDYLQTFLINIMIYGEFK